MIKKLYIGVCVLAIMGMLSAPQRCGAGTESLSNEAYAAALVNYIRLDPMAYAAGLGYDRARLLQALPWLSSISGGLEASELSDFLNRRAFAKNSQETTDFGPVPDFNTDFASAGDIGGVVSFRNFMDPCLAINVIINNQVCRELDSKYEGNRYVLSSDYHYVGAALRSGRTGFKNAYYITVCFGTSLLKSEAQVINLINQMRANPVGSSKYVTLNNVYLPGGYPPLFLNPSLRKAAEKGLSEYVDYPTYALFSGFSGLGVVASSALEVYPNMDRNFYALWIFSSLILKEDAAYPAKNSLFNSDYNQIGVAGSYVDGVEYDYSKVVAVAGISQDPEEQVSKIYGVAFKDSDENGIYTPGEDAADKVVIVYDHKTLEKVTSVVTNAAGQFTLCLEQNKEYLVQTGEKETLSGQIVFLDGDHFLPLKVL